MAAELAHARGGIEAASVSHAWDAIQQHSPSSITSPSTRVSSFVLLVKSCVCGMAPAKPSNNLPSALRAQMRRPRWRAHTNRQEACCAPREDYPGEGCLWP